MKTFFKIIIYFLILNCIHFSAKAQLYNVYDLNGNETDRVSVKVSDLTWADGNEYTLSLEEYKNTPLDIDPLITENAKDYEQVIIIDFKTDDEENLYPEIETLNFSVNNGGKTNTGGRVYLGKEYRLVYFSEDSTVDYTDNITYSDKWGVECTITKLGKYVIYFNPNVYDVTFYLGMPIYDEDHCITNPECIYEYKEFDNKVIFPKIPKKDGYVFMGWYVYMYYGEHYPGSQPITASYFKSYFAKWVPEDEYIPLEITLTPEKEIIKGQEDGSTILLNINQGNFIEEDLPTGWTDDYERALKYWDEYDGRTLEELKEDVINSWKENWNIIGNDEVYIDKVERIDDTNIRLTLAGNSSDIYTKDEIKLEFLYWFYDGSNKNIVYDKETDRYYSDVEEKYSYQLDEDGVMKNKFITDNSITLHAQKKPSRGGSLRPVEVKADTDKSSEQDKADVTEENTDIKDTENVTDTNTKEPVIDTEASDDNSAEKSKKDTSADNSIIFTIGSKTVTVSGEEKENDVAPIIRNGRTMLPARFVAEALGAAVNWDEIKRTVTVTKDEIKIVITIDSQTAVINGEEIKLDSPAFIESGRTYTPLRLIAESLGASVDWDEDTKTVTIK